MDFKLNEMEQEIVDMLHDFCLKEVKPIAAELDEKEEFTQNAREKLRWVCSAPTSPKSTAALACPT